jgi:outer membrane protein assembly factor BamB
MISLRESLKKIDEPHPGKTIPVFPHGFQSFPRSLKKAMHAMNSPDINKWTLINTATFENYQWTEECQGLTSDGESWFIVSNNEHHKGIYKFTFDFRNLLGATEIPWPADHVGDPDYHNGKIYVPVESSSTPHVWILDTNLVNLGVLELDASSKQGTRMPWCAINPWDGYLYTSIFANSDPDKGDYGLADRLYVYDPNHNFLFKKEFPLVGWGAALHNVQGGCFSNNGHIYISTGSISTRGYVHAYSALNGQYLGQCFVPSDWSPGEGEEMEGLAICHLTVGGKDVYVHAIVLDNDWMPGDQDDVYLKSFSVPRPDFL